MDHTYSKEDFNTNELPSYPQFSKAGQQYTTEWCFVPQCTNTAKNSKKFFCRVPSSANLKRRKLWFARARRTYNVSDKTHLFACDDHFDVSESLLMLQ